MKNIGFLLVFVASLPAFAISTLQKDIEEHINNDKPLTISPVTADDVKARLKARSDSFAAAETDQELKQDLIKQEKETITQHFESKISVASKAPSRLGPDISIEILEDQRDGEILKSLCENLKEKCDDYTYYKAEYKKEVEALDKKCRGEQDEITCLLFKTRHRILANSFDEFAEIGSGPIPSPNKIKPETCEWSFDLPRRVIEIPGCSQNQRSSSCVGYVVCENTAGVKLVRMSTCSANNCGENDAVACTKEGGFSSKNVGDDIDTASKKVMDIIITPRAINK